MRMVTERVRQDMMQLCDTDYAAFMAALVPTLSRERILGVRMPQLRRYAKRFFEDPEREDFLTALPHQYQEENMLHALLLAQKRGPFDAVIGEIERFLPLIDNWAVCDSFSPCCFAAEREKTYAFCLRCLDYAHPYTVRFGIVTLLNRYLKDGFDASILPRLAALPTEEYYVNMAVAWYLSQALADQWEATLPAFEQNLFGIFVHNKAIQKAIESFRIAEDHKALLRTLRRRPIKGEMSL